MPFLELYDETLDINSTENYELSVQAGNDGVSCTILDTLRNKFILLRSYEPDDNGLFDHDKMYEIISRDDFLTRPYKKINVIVPSAKATLVPSALYEESEKEGYFTFNQIRLEGEIILTNEIADPDAVIIFALPGPATDLLNRSFPKGRICHQLKPLFNYLHLNRRATGDHYVHVHLEKDFFNLVIFDQSVLKFCNTFHYQTLSDIQYYVLYVLRRMNVGQEESVCFSGRRVKPKELDVIFSDYIKTIIFAEPSGNFTFSYVFNDTDLYRFLNLFSSTNCE